VQHSQPAEDDEVDAEQDDHRMKAVSRAGEERDPEDVGHTLTAAPSQRWRVSLALESDAASAAASTMLAAPAA
jgi:hypothetical protein